MKNSKPLIFVSLSAIVIFAAFAWMSVFMLQAERSREKNAVRTQLVEQSRIALWRMDSLFSSILNKQGACLPEDFFTSESRGEFETERFEIFPAALKQVAGTLPGELARDKALLNFAATVPMLGEDDLSGDYSDAESQEQTDFDIRKEVAEKSFFAQQMFQNASFARVYRRTPQGIPMQSPIPEKHNAEQTRMVSAFSDNAAYSEPVQPEGQPRESFDAEAVTEFVGPIRAIWFENQLFCIRSIADAGGNVLKLQCVRMDSEELFAYLLSVAQDLLPEAQLLGGRVSENELFALASFPATLIPGAPAGTPNAGDAFSSLELSLALAWGCLILAMIGVIGFVAGTLRMSERRAVFVSAVTHELRTPLTTFGMYAEMLEAGLVPEDKRKGYYSVLRREAKRLSNLVENVLAFAKVERNGGAQLRRERITVLAVRDAVLVRAEKRLAEAGMKAEVLVEPTARNFFVKTDISALEQILFNLADNAAKYAAVPDGTVKIEFGISGKFLEISFLDCGQGVPEEFRSKLFEPFSRSAKTAAGKQPGVGLGLALCKRLANELGGDLHLGKSGSAGTEFLLRVCR